MNVTELSQTVVEPEDRSDELIKRLYEASKAQEERNWPNLKLFIGRVLHPFGVHTWMRWMQYDRASDRVIDTGGRVCAWCTKGRLRP